MCHRRVRTHLCMPLLISGPPFWNIVRYLLQLFTQCAFVAKLRLNFQQSTAAVPGSAHFWLRECCKMTRCAMDAALSSPECTLKIKPAFYSIFHVLIIVHHL